MGSDCPSAHAHGQYLTPLDSLCFLFLPTCSHVCSVILGLVNLNGTIMMNYRSFMPWAWGAPWEIRGREVVICAMHWWLITMSCALHCHRLQFYLLSTVRPVSPQKEWTYWEAVPWDSHKSVIPVILLGITHVSEQVGWSRGIHDYEGTRKLKRCSHQDGILDFPGGPVVNSLPANAGDTGSVPGLGQFHIPQDN